MKRSRFSLRDVFWLVLVVALVLGWWLNRKQLVDDNLRLGRQNQAAIEQARIAAHDWWREAIKSLSDVDRLYLLAKLAAEQPRPNYEVIQQAKGP